MKAKILESDYNTLLSEIKRRIQEARNRAYLSVNREMLLLYWEIGMLIAQKQEVEGWGAKVIQRLSDDLRAEIPDGTSFSLRKDRKSVV